VPETLATCGFKQDLSELSFQRDKSKETYPPAAPQPPGNQSLNYLRFEASEEAVYNVAMALIQSDRPSGNKRASKKEF